MNWGGKGMLGKIWVELKDEGKTRMDKRKNPEDIGCRKSSPIKFRKIVGRTNNKLTKKSINPTNDFMLRHADSPRLPATPDLGLKPVQTKMTSYLNSSSKKIGSKPDRTMPKKNPNQLIPPCGPKLSSRRLFNMQDLPEELEGTLSAAKAILHPKSAVPADPKPQDSLPASPSLKTTAPESLINRNDPIPAVFPASPAAANPSQAATRSKKKTGRLQKTILPSLPPPRTPDEPNEASRSSKKPQPLPATSAKPTRNAALSKLPQPALSHAKIATSK